MSDRDVIARIKAVSADEELNTKTMIALAKETDCFGHLYDSEHKQCIRCNILIELDGRREAMSVFCHEFSKNGKEEIVGIKEEIFTSETESKTDSVEPKDKNSKLEKNEMSEEIATKKRRSKEEVDAIVALKNAGKSFEEIQVAIREQFKVERPLKSLKDMLKSVETETPKAETTQTTETV
jgi:hypothetical protein